MTSSNAGTAGSWTMTVSRATGANAAQSTYSEVPTSIRSRRRNDGRSAAALELLLLLLLPLLMPSDELRDRDLSLKSSVLHGSPAQSAA